MSLGDGFGFLLFFRVVSGDYGEPWSITVCDLLLDSSNLSWVCGVLISKTWGWWNPSPMMLENSHTTEKQKSPTHIVKLGAATISSCLCIRKTPRETDFLMRFWGSFLCNDLLGQRGMWGKRSSHSTRQKPQKGKRWWFCVESMFGRCLVQPLNKHPFKNWGWSFSLSMNNTHFHQKLFAFREICVKNYRLSRKREYPE